MLRRIADKIRLWLILRERERIRKAYEKRPYYGVERRKGGRYMSQERDRFFASWEGKR